MTSYGYWSIIPPFIAIGTAYATRQVIPSLALSIFVGATILSGSNPALGFGTMFRDHIVGAVADPWNVTIILVCLTLGGMIGIIAGAGGMRAVAERLAARAKTPRGAQFATAVLGLAIFFDDYANALLVGAAMRPVTDRLRISREKLAYLCDSTAAPVASISLVSTWATYEMGILRGVFDTIGLRMNSYEALIRSLPYRFYSIFTLVFVFALVWFGRDFGPMRRAEERARWTGRLLREGAVPLAGTSSSDEGTQSGHWMVAVVPLVVLLTGMLGGLMITGWPALAAENSAGISFAAIRDIIGAADGALSMLWAAALGSLVAGGLALSYRVLSFGGVIERWLDGARSVLVAVVVLVLAWGIGHVCRDLGTAAFISGAIADWIPPGLIPLVSFALGCTIAFATGTAYGTVAILMPLAVPLVYTLTGTTDGLFFATIGAIFTGAVFGDHCSPISDTTVMSSMACASDHIDHVRTQLPYALTCAVIAVIAGFLPSAMGVHPVFSLIGGTMLAIAAVRFIGRSY